MRRKPNLSRIITIITHQPLIIRARVRAQGVPAPGMTASLGYFDTYRRERLPANLVQVCTVQDMI